MNSENLLTLKQVADILNVTWQTVRNYVKNEELSAIKLSEDRNYRVDPIELCKFIQKKQVKNELSYQITLDELIYENRLKSKNCELIYENKKDKSDILELEFDSTDLELINREHDGQYINSIFWGDNLIILSKLLNEFKGKVDLIYIDPPFGTNSEFFLYDGETGYEDKQINNIYLEFLRERLILLRELLSEKGSIYLHIDKKMSHYVKIILDEVFGEANFLNEITRIKCNPKNFARKAYGNYTDVIFFYAKEKDKNIFNDVTIPLTEDEVEKAFEKTDENGMRYTTHPLHAPGVTKDGVTGAEWNGMLPPEGRHWRYKPEVLDELLANNKIEISKTGNPRKKVYACDHKGKKQQDLWEYKDKGVKYTTYPTEKNIDMLRYIIENSSNEDSIIMDAFAGSFKFLVEGYEMKRKVIGIDCNESAINTGLKNFAQRKLPINYYKLVEVEDIE